jgi:hypothetical protein
MTLIKNIFSFIINILKLIWTMITYAVDSYKNYKVSKKYAKSIDTEIQETINKHKIENLDTTSNSKNL